MGINSIEVDKRRAVFLDRDGVLNRVVVRKGTPHPPSTLEEMEVPPEVADALSLLRERHFLLLVVTNQPDVARGSQQRRIVELMHLKLRSSLPLDDFFVCYHDDEEGCSCRKPLPGLLLEAAQKYDIDLASSFMIGDRWRDIDAGASAGCKTILIDQSYQEREPSHCPDARVTSLSAAVEWVLENASF